MKKKLNAKLVWKLLKTVLQVRDRTVNKCAQGVLETSVLVVDGAPVNTSVAFVPGELAIKSKKGHGIITTPKSKKEKDTDEEVDEEETSEENED